MTAEHWDSLYSHPNNVFGYKPNDYLKQQIGGLAPLAGQGRTTRLPTLRPESTTR